VAGGPWLPGDRPGRAGSPRSNPTHAITPGPVDSRPGGERRCPRRVAGVGVVRIPGKGVGRL